MSIDDARSVGTVTGTTDSPANLTTVEGISFAWKTSTVQAALAAQ